jgi:transcriptional regulator GlxA family with amidase domain
MRKIGFIIYPGYQPMGLASTTPFEIANRQAAEPVYDIRILSKHGGLVRTSVGFHVSTVRFTEEPYDLIVVGASMEAASPETIELAVTKLHGTVTIRPELKPSNQTVTQE